jgi:hypothetical protein
MTQVVIFRSRLHQFMAPDGAVHGTVDIALSEVLCTVVHFSTVVCTKQQLLQVSQRYLSEPRTELQKQARPAADCDRLPGISNTIGN